MNQLEPPPVTTPEETLELSQERESIQSGIATYRERVRNLTAKELGSLTDPVAKLMTICIEPMANGIVEWVMQARKSPTRKATALKYIEQVDSDAAALITLRRILNKINKPRPAQSVAVSIGAALEDEIRLQSFEEQQPKLYSKIQEYVDDSPQAYRLDYRRRVLMHGVGKYKVTHQAWSEDVKLMVGITLIELMVRTTGLIELKTQVGKRASRMQTIVVATAKLLEWVDDAHAKCEAMCPPRMPMFCPPRPFTKLNDGGYLLPELRRPLVRIKDAAMRSLASMTHMPQVYAAVNAIQATPMRVNQAVFEVVTQLWEHGQDVPGAARRTDKPLPERPPHGCPDPIYRQYKSDAREIYNENLANHGRRIGVANTLLVARRCGSRPIWFPVFLDFRGRVYSVPQHLSPQGSDLSKGLLEFAEGVPLGPTGAKWVEIHLANCYGVDKVSAEQRRAWVHENRGMILRVAEDPYSNREWHDADAPVEFLAACIDYAGYVRDGEGHVSHLMIKVDGTCNGIQHLAAMSRDSVAGREVNLIPNDKPADIYTRVAEEATAELDGVAKGEIILPGKRTPEQCKEMALRWLLYGVKRDVTKRPTMILPYGGTLSAVQDYVSEAVTKRTREGIAHPFGRFRDRHEAFGAKVIWSAMSRVVDGPRKVMAWTKQLAKALNKSGRAIQWVSPSGFPVRQAYLHTKSRRVKTRVGDVSIRVSLAATTDRINARRQSQALAPNWIHSLDAAALHLTVVSLQRSGVSSVVMIHDSYGAHAANMDVMASTLRDEFVQIYRTDVMAKFRDDVTQPLLDRSDVPALPERGDLDIEQVLQSPHFFL